MLVSVVRHLCGCCGAHEEGAHEEPAEIRSIGFERVAAWDPDEVPPELHECWEKTAFQSRSFLKANSAHLCELPDELLSAVARVLWNPVVPETLDPLSATCRRLRSVILTLAAQELRRELLFRDESSNLAGWGGLVIGPPWHLRPDREGYHDQREVRRNALQSFARFVIVRNSSDGAALYAAMRTHWHLASPTLVVQLEGGDGYHTGHVIPDDVLGTCTHGLAQLSAQSAGRCWLLTDGLKGRRNEFRSIAQLLGKGLREACDCPGLPRTPHVGMGVPWSMNNPFADASTPPRTFTPSKGLHRPRPVLLGFSPMRHLACHERMHLVRRGQQLVIDQSRRSGEDWRLALERHHTHLVLTTPPPARAPARGSTRAPPTEALLRRLLRTLVGWEEVPDTARDEEPAGCVGETGAGAAGELAADDAADADADAGADADADADAGGGAAGAAAGAAAAGSSPTTCVLVLIGGDGGGGAGQYSPAVPSQWTRCSPFDALYWHLAQGWHAVVVTSSGGAAEVIEELLQQQALPPPADPPVLSHECVRQHRAQIHLARGRVHGELEMLVQSLCAGR